jgi:hypothetical protein
MKNSKLNMVYTKDSYVYFYTSWAIKLIVEHRKHNNFLNMPFKIKPEILNFDFSFQLLKKKNH